jgi:hypothetical protein
MYSGVLGEVPVTDQKRRPGKLRCHGVVGGEVDAGVVDDDFFSTRRDLELRAPTTPPTLQRSTRLSE